MFRRCCRNHTTIVWPRRPTLFALDKRIRIFKFSIRERNQSMVTLVGFRLMSQNLVICGLHIAAATNCLSSNKYRLQAAGQVLHLEPAYCQLVSVSASQLRVHVVQWNRQSSPVRTLASLFTNERRIRTVNKGRDPLASDDNEARQRP